MEKNYKRQWDAVLAVVVTIIMFAVIGLCSDIVYYLNDDTTIQSVLSGRYSGTAGGMAVYFNQPLSGLLALFFRAVPGIPWFGVFLEGCYILCFFLVLYNSLKCVKNAEFKKTIILKICVCILCAAGFLGFFLGQYLMPHYTVAASVVGGTALYLFLISNDSREWKETIRQSWPSVLLLIFCFLIRTNVFFMVLPFLAVAGIYRMVRTRSVVNYLPLLGFMCGGVLIFLLIGKLAYGDTAWKEYLDYNDARTLLYDYAGIWEEDAATEYYSNHGYEPEEIAVYRNYNVLLNEKLTAEDYRVLASYAELRPDGQRTTVQRLKDGFWLYRNRELLTAEDRVYSNMVLVFYLLAIVLMAAGKDFKSLFMLVLLGGTRSILWVYLLAAGRYPERIIISLYLIEFLILSAMIVNAMGLPAVSAKGHGMEAVGDRENTSLVKSPFKIMRQIGAYLACFVLFILSLETAGGLLPDILGRSRQQIIINSEEDKLYEYMKSHPENLYLLDVYCVVDHTEYVFKEYDKTYENYMLLGGWIAGSPLAGKKLADWGYESAFEALLEGENVYLVLKDDVGMTLEELQAYCALRNDGDKDFDQIEVIETDRGNYRIYQRTPGL